MTDRRRVAAIGLLAALVCASACSKALADAAASADLAADETAQAFEAVRGTGRVAIIFEHDGGRYVREFYWRR